MKTCQSCGHQNEDGARFCELCGHQLGDTGAQQPRQPQQPPQPHAQPYQSNQTVSQQPYQPQGQPYQAQQPYQPAERPLPSYGEEPKKNNKIVLITLIVCAVLVVTVAAIVFLGKEDETPAEQTMPNIQKVEYDTAIQSGAFNVDSAAISKAETPTTTSSTKATGRGEIEGYPFSVSGKWNGDKFSGTYKNEYNGVKMSCSGQRNGDQLELTLSSGKSKCYFSMSRVSGEYYSGVFMPGNKSASLTF